MRKQLVFVDDEENILSGIRRNLFNVNPDWEIHLFAKAEEAIEYGIAGRIINSIDDLK